MEEKWRRRVLEGEKEKILIKRKSSPNPFYKLASLLLLRGWFLSEKKKETKAFLNRKELSRER